MIDIRASSMDLLFLCPPAVLADGGLRVKGTIPEAETGSAVHECLEEILAGGSYDADGVVGRRGLSEPQAEDLRMLAGYGARAWAELSAFFPQQQTEAKVAHRLDGTEINVSGTIDVVSPAGAKKAIFLDWKSGRLDSSFHQQMSTYAWLLWMHMGKPTDIEITGIIVFLRHGYYRVVRWTSQKIMDWEADLRRNVLGGPATYHPGEHCTFCSKYHSCLARQQVTEKTLDAVMFGASNMGDTAYEEYLGKAKRLMMGLTADNKHAPEVAQTVSDLLFRAKLAKQAVEDLDTIIRTTVERVGQIDLGGGEAIALRDVERKKLDSCKTIVALRGRMSDQELAAAATYSLPKIREAAAKNAVKGAKSQAANEIEQELLTAGAISVTKSARLERIHAGGKGEEEHADTTGK